MDLARLIESSPNTLRVRTDLGDSSYRLADDLIATHEAGASEAAIATFEGGNISVQQAALASTLRVVEGTVGPVYRQQPGGRVAVPTGRALVRFAEGERADRHRDELKVAGFEVEAVLTYAPHAAWVRASSGVIADTLRHLDLLERLPNVKHVEPQIITEVSTRL